MNEYYNWIGNTIQKKSGKPFKNKEKIVIPVGLTINQQDRKKRIDFILEDKSIVNCEQCEKAEYAQTSNL